MYLRRVVSSSHDQGLQFDGRRLALRVDPRDPRNTPRPTVWNLRHAPAPWHVEEIEEVLRGVGFTEVEVLAKSKDRRNVSWTFRAMRTHRRQYVPIVVEDEEGPFELEAARQRRKPKDAPTQPIRDVRRQSVSFDIQELLCATAAKGGGKIAKSKRKGTATPAAAAVTAASAAGEVHAPTSGLDLLDLDILTWRSKMGTPLWRELKPLVLERSALLRIRLKPLTKTQSRKLASLSSFPPAP